MNVSADPSYIGRFAPSPTGSLHIGSLYTALASFLHARSRQGKWLLRIDDSDTFRNIKGATESIVDTLDCYGLDWDDPIQFQTSNQHVYDAVISKLQSQQLVYPCICTRRALASLNTVTYPKFCQNIQLENEQPYALRIKSKQIEICFDDELQGPQLHIMDQQHGDFIVKRKDNITAYQLAVVIDDHQQNVTHVTRGFDLLDSTPKQIFLQNILGYPTPKYCHIPIITDPKGIKLSKQTFAQAVSTKNSKKTLFLLLRLLKQAPPARLRNATVSDIIDWGIEHWQPEPLKKIQSISNTLNDY